jgi:hypothetical protein
MSYQAIFDTAYLSIVEQGAPGYDQANGTCSYFSTDINGREMRCAIGHLLPDAIARQFGSKIQCVYDLADRIIPVVTERFGLDVSSRDERLGLINLLSHLQCAHDDASETGSRETFLDDYYTGMREVAKSFALSTEVLDR